MQNIDLLHLREQFNAGQILLCFNGPISRSLIEEIGNALKNYLQAENATPSAVMDVFGVYIEITQNIRHYAQQRGYNDIESAATIVVARHSETQYAILAGNLVEPDDAQVLCARIQTLAGMDKAALKAAYKTQLRQPREGATRSGAGLGLLDMARKASCPIEARAETTSQGKTFFSMMVVV